MIYKEGDTIAFFRDGEIVTDEVMFVRGEIGRQYYHTRSDDYMFDSDVVGSVVDGKRKLDPDYIDHCERQINHLEQAINDAKMWSSGND